MRDTAAFVEPVALQCWRSWNSGLFIRSCVSVITYQSLDSFSQWAFCLSNEDKMTEVIQYSFVVYSALAPVESIFFLLLQHLIK